MSLKEEFRNGAAVDDNVDEMSTYTGDNLEFNDGRSDKSRRQTLKSTNLNGHRSSRSVRSDTTSLLPTNENQ